MFHFSFSLASFLVSNILNLLPLKSYWQATRQDFLLPWKMRDYDDPYRRIRGLGHPREPSWAPRGHIPRGRSPRGMCPCLSLFGLRSSYALQGFLLAPAPTCPRPRRRNWPAQISGVCRDQNFFSRPRPRPLSFGGRRQNNQMREDLWAPWKGSLFDLCHLVLGKFRDERLLSDFPYDHTFHRQLQPTETTSCMWRPLGTKPICPPRPLPIIYPACNGTKSWRTERTFCNYVQSKCIESRFQIKYYLRLCFAWQLAILELHCIFGELLTMFDATC